MQDQKRDANKLPSMMQLETMSGRELVDTITDYLADRQHSLQAKLAAETTILWFARKRWDDYCLQDIRARLHEQALTGNLSVPLERISAVTACMNRNAHILTTLPSWLSSKRFEEIIIVDYGSIEPVENTLAKADLLNHPSIRVIRVEANQWCLAEAFNIGLFEARAPFTMKLDADTLVLGQAAMSLRLTAREFKTGNWRTFVNNILNGIALAPTNAIKKVGGYNEQLRRYGWDDCDFYERLSELFLTKTDLDEQEFSSLDHSDEERVAHSDEMAKANDINRLIQGNRVFTNLLPKWTDKSKRQFAFHALDDNDKKIIERLRDIAYKISEIQDAYIYSEDSVYGYSAMLKDLFAQISNGDQQNHALTSIKRTPIILMVSLYEDQAEARQREMIRCLRSNIQVFDRIIVLYENSAGNSDDLGVSIADELKQLASLNCSDRQLAQLEVISIKERPSYRDFFEISKRFHSDPHSPWFVIANADIAFDESIERINELENSEHTIICLSRWDQCGESATVHANECYTDAAGDRWCLIESVVNESRIPNYLSADAWIYKRLPDNWEEYTYKLGTYFCDSFFINRAFRSGMAVINPCHSIRCLHYHDTAHNSSDQKFEDKGRIEELHRAERERLGGEEPAAGAQWATLETCMRSDYKPKPYRWNQNGGRWLHLGHIVNLESTLLMIEACSKVAEHSGNDYFLTVTSNERYAGLFKIVLKFAQYLGNPNLFLDVRTGDFDPSSKTCEETLRFPGIHRLSNSNWLEIARHITHYVEQNPYAQHSDRTHLQLLRLFVIDELYSVQFLSEKYPERFQLARTEAVSGSRFASLRQATSRTTEPRFSLVTSLFRAEKYLSRLLENYEAIATLGHCELIIVDVNSDNADQLVVDRFIQSSDYGDTVQYIRLEEDPGIYGCWMQGISMAKSPLVSNFNADDRRSAIHPHLLADYLEKNPTVDVCFTALKPTRVVNQSWYEHVEEESWFHWYQQGQEFELEDFLTISDGVYCSQNIAHCMPMWRKYLHDILGPFREDLYGTSADWAFWLECLKRKRRLHLASRVPLGLYYVNPESHNRIHDAEGQLENKILSDYFSINQTSFLQQ
jgi:glycosyltransferase involved in cell wall biosynthesis